MPEPSDRPRRVFATWTFLKDGRAEVEDDVDKYRLNETGTHLWLRFDGSRTLAELADEIASENGEDDATCLADTMEFADRLAAYRLIELEPRPGADSS